MNHSRKLLSASTIPFRKASLAVAFAETSCSVGIAPSDPMADSERVDEDENRSALLDFDALKANMLLAALDGRFEIIGKNGKSAPIEVSDVPERVKSALEAKDMDKAYALLIAECAK